VKIRWRSPYERGRQREREMALNDFKLLKAELEDFASTTVDDGATVQHAFWLIDNIIKEKEGE